MVLAALRQVDKHYGEQTVLGGATLEMRGGDRIALIGRNGAGKSTILRLLDGRERPDAGEAWTRDDAVVSLLTQDPEFPPGHTVREVCEAAFQDLDEMEARLQALEADGLDDPDTFARWEVQHATFERRGGYRRRARRDMVLHALAFTGREHEDAGRLSGGEKTRLALARLLMRQPDVLLLDEPTNHLDVEMRTWLESYLAHYPGAALIVSHDRAFLDGACDQTAEVGRGRLHVRPGNPTRYRQERAEQERIEARTRHNQHKEEARLEGAAAKMRKWAGQNAKLMRRAKSMETRLERHRQGMLDDAERPGRTVRFTFPCDPRGTTVLQAHHLSKRFGAEALFQDVAVTVRNGERIAVTGPNGAGKTTFLRVLLGELPSDDPRARIDYGTHVRVGYYDQELRGVDPEFTLIEELIRLVGDREGHDLLGKFMFPFGAQYKKVRDLSGGERARLALLKLTLGQHDVLVLDEPTNHLDVEMIEALEAALDVFEGTLLLVSHDRRFVSSLATRVWEIQDGQFEDYEGDWSFYERKAQERRTALQEAQDASTPPPEAEAPARHQTRAARAADAAVDARFRDLSPWKLERELAQLEDRVATLESELAELQGRLADPAMHIGEHLAELGRAHARTESDLLAAMEAWEAAGKALETKRAARGQ
ncbi:MAG: ABC-F family ATP-binding cassette domain-containing protein [Trueperaceae bacterium]|nr:ABC-F family ATP-binding cassette domain-containing protein [Trueperaceae bacterium]